MLKTIAGVLKPTTGKVEVCGTVAPLIELGAGFDMDLTARENVFLNGALLGYGREEMEKHYDNIVEFSELQFYGCSGQKLFFRYGVKACVCNCDDRDTGHIDR